MTLVSLSKAAMPFAELLTPSAMTRGAPYATAVAAKGTAKPWLPGTSVLRLLTARLPTLAVPAAAMMLLLPAWSGVLSAAALPLTGAGAGGLVAAAALGPLDRSALRRLTGVSLEL